MAYTVFEAHAPFHAYNPTQVCREIIPILARTQRKIGFFNPEGVLPIRTKTDFREGYMAGNDDVQFAATRNRSGNTAYSYVGVCVRKEHSRDVSAALIRAGITFDEINVLSTAKLVHFPQVANRFYAPRTIPSAQKQMQPYLTQIENALDNKGWELIRPPNETLDALRKTGLTQGDRIRLINNIEPSQLKLYETAYIVPRTLVKYPEAVASCTEELQDTKETEFDEHDSCGKGDKWPSIHQMLVNELTPGIASLRWGEHAFDIQRVEYPDLERFLAHFPEQGEGSNGGFDLKFT
ncbi:MAG: hypothetical protein ACI8Y7_001046 [Candidatus Woesearchaeota archaeon]|jgi:hypothetical protein